MSYNSYECRIETDEGGATMETIKGKVKRNFTVSDELTIQGEVVGDVDLSPNAIVIVNGTIKGTVTLLRESTVRINGTVVGEIVTHGGLVQVDGSVVGDITADENGVVVINATHMGNLILYPTSDGHLHGTLIGEIVNKGGNVHVDGTV